MKENKKGEEKDMNAILKKSNLELQDKLNRISSKAPKLNTKNGMIELNRNNPQHKEWFDIDKYKGK